MIYLVSTILFAIGNLILMHARRPGDSGPCGWYDLFVWLTGLFMVYLAGMLVVVGKVGVVWS